MWSPRTKRKWNSWVFLRKKTFCTQHQKSQKAERNSSSREIYTVSHVWNLLSISKWHFCSLILVRTERTRERASPPPSNWKHRRLPATFLCVLQHCRTIRGGCRDKRHAQWQSLSRQGQAKDPPFCVGEVPLSHVTPAPFLQHPKGNHNSNTVLPRYGGVVVLWSTLIPTKTDFI